MTQTNNGRPEHLCADVLTFLADKVGPAETRVVTDEPILIPPVVPHGFTAGTAPRGVLTWSRGQASIPARAACDTTSLRVRVNGRTLVRGSDYLVDEEWATLGQPPGATQMLPATVDYRFSLLRVDAVVRSADGDLRLLAGYSDIASPMPPPVPDGTSLEAYVFVPAFSDGAEFEAFAAPSPPPRGRSMLERLPKLSSRLRDGAPTRVVCWGDSVTGGCTASSDWTAFPALVERGLRAAYPRSAPTVAVVSGPGSTSLDWLPNEAGPDGEVVWDWDLVAAHDPHLAVVEFVNDAGLDPTCWDALYSQIAVNHPDDRGHALAARAVLDALEA